MVHTLKKAYRTLTFLSVYILFFIPALLGFSYLWSEKIEGFLYECNDPIPFLSFIPPFVHGYNGVSFAGDYYIYSPLVVYATWVIFIVLILGLPALISFLVTRRLKVK